MLVIWRSMFCLPPTFLVLLSWLGSLAFSPVVSVVAKLVTVVTVWLIVAIVLDMLFVACVAILLEIMAMPFTAVMTVMAIVSCLLFTVQIKARKLARTGVLDASKNTGAGVVELT
mmetsp:Transcript_7014/g.12464  ORF Transcript_7014/g.12464 Transcript_7014/m.12464 type:complete len:115 (+) Transcript_7014:1488-1832(+)